MRLFFVFGVLLSASVSQSVTFACMSLRNTGLNESEVAAPIALEGEFGTQTLELGFTFDGYGRDDEVEIFDHLDDDPAFNYEPDSVELVSMAVSSSDFAKDMVW